MERLSPHLRRFLLAMVREDGVRRRFISLHCGTFGISSLAHVVDEIFTKKSFLHTRYEAFTAVGMKLQLREIDVLLRCDGTQGHGEDVEAQTKQSDGVEKEVRLEMERSNQLVKGKTNSLIDRL
jgi:hypothetical protein